MNGTVKLDSIKQQPLTTSISNDENQKVQDQAKIKGRGVLDGVERTEIEVKKEETLLRSKPPTLKPPTENLEQKVFQDTADKLNVLVQPKAMLDIFAVMAEFYKSSTELRDLSQKSARASLESQVQSIQNQSKSIRDSAKQAMIAGILMGSFTILAGAASAFGSYRSVGKPTDALSNATMQAYKGLSDTFSGVGKIFEAGFNYASQDIQATGKQYEADSTKAGGERDEMLKFRDTMAEHMSSTLSTLQQIMQSREQTVSKIFA